MCSGYQSRIALASHRECRARSPSSELVFSSVRCPCRAEHRPVSKAGDFGEGPQPGVYAMKRSTEKRRIGDFDVRWALELVLVTRKDDRAEHYDFIVSPDQARILNRYSSSRPDILEGDASVNEAWKAAEEFLRQEREDKGNVPSTASAD
jgi:hypothetical protein